MTQSPRRSLSARTGPIACAAAVLTASVPLLAIGCQGRGHGAAGAAASGSAASSPAPAPVLTQAARLLRAERAAKLFRTECAGCHGERGRGDGPAAAFVAIKPRNFVAEKFKVRTTNGGDAPTKQDIFDTITRGMLGSAMPPFKFLTEEERWLLTDHVWNLAGLDAKKPGKVVAITQETPNDGESVRRGRVIYERFECGKCHGAEGKANGPSAKHLKDDLGRAILPRDLTRDPFRGGDSIAAINLRFRTGMDGTPMPTYADSFKEGEGWDLAHYVASLRLPKEAPPSDPIAYGRRVVEEKQCNGCHVLEGKGARVGPNLDVSAQKLRYAWAKQFLGDPRAAGKVYPYLVYRMPDLGLTDPEIEALLALFAKVANRSYPEDEQKPIALDEAKVKDGQLLYFLKCTECHNMGTVIPLPEAKRQGPDLINVSKRMRFDFIPKWVKAPQDVSPGSAMVDTNLNPEQIEAVAAFVWKTSVDAQEKRPQ